MNKENALTLYGVTPESAQKILAFVATLKKKAKAKEAEEEEEEGEEEEEAEEAEEGTEEEAEEESEEEEEAEEESEEENAPKATLKQVIAALQKYSDKHGRPAGMKILSKFGVKSTHKLEKKDYQKVIDETKKKK